MYKFIFLFVVFCSTLISEEEAINTYLTSEVDNLSLFEGMVNAQNGRLVQIDKDIEIQSTDPLEFIRYYDGGHDHKGVCGYGFGLSFPILLTFNSEQNELEVEQRGGSSLPFTMEKMKKGYYEGNIKYYFITNGYTNFCEGLLRGEKDVTAITVKGSRKSSFVVDLGNGVKRHYGRYLDKKTDDTMTYFRLCIEERENGNLRKFEYEDNHKPRSPTRIWTTNKNQSLMLNWMTFEYGKNGVNVRASNEENVYYELLTTDVTTRKKSHNKDKDRKIKLLWEVSGKHLLKTNYHIHQKKIYSASIFEIPYIKRPDGRNFNFVYDDKERVKKIYTAGVEKSLYTFDYQKDHTLVYDGFKNKRRYDFKNQRLVKYKDSSSTHRYKWSDTGKLQSHSIKDLKTNKITLQEYAYDAVGNITEAKVTGNITQNGSKDFYVVRYTYSQDGRNNVNKENHNHEREFIYDYQPGTNLVVRKLTFADQGFVEREFSDYDENAILIKKTVDDGSTPDASNLTGVSYRLITEIEPQLNPNLPGMTLPKVIKEYYLDLQTGQQHLLKKVEKTYTQGDLLAINKVYDANGNYCYSNMFEYNDRKELVKEIDAYGVATVCQYDDNKNKIYVEKLGSQKKNRYVYDLANRLIEEIEEHENGRVLKTSHTYDIMGNRLSTTNHMGQTTTYQYDSSGRVISSYDPLGLCEHKEYDAKGNIIKSIDKDGFVTLTSYNIHGKPLEICYPDGTSKRFAYNLQGHLIQEWERDNRSTIYEVDYKGNAKNSRIYGSDGALKKQHQKTFKGSKVFSEVDSMGNVTSYQYDGAGRKVSETKEDQTTYYEYDNLGNLFKTIDAETVEIKIYDFLGRVVEERTEDLFGQIYEKSRKSYDINGNCISNISYKNSSDFTESKTIYNSENLPILQIDPQGNQTTIAYRYTDHLEKQVHDPMGRKEVTIYDRNNRIHAIHRLSANHEHLACRSFSYDGRNNKTIQ